MAFLVLPIILYLCALLAVLLEFDVPIASLATSSFHASDSARWGAETLRRLIFILGVVPRAVAAFQNEFFRHAARAIRSEAVPSDGICFVCRPLL